VAIGGDRACDIGTIVVMPRSEIHQDQIAFFNVIERSHVVEASAMDAARHNRREAHALVTGIIIDDLKEFIGEFVFFDVGTN